MTPSAPRAGRAAPPGRRRASAGSWLGQRPPGARVVTGRSVGDVCSVLLVGVEVSFGAVVLFPAAVSSAAVSIQSAARHAAAQGSRRQSPDISNSALVFRRELRRTTLGPSLSNPRRRLRDSALPDAGVRWGHVRDPCRGLRGRRGAEAGRGRNQLESCGRGRGVLRRNQGRLSLKVTVV